MIRVEHVRERRDGELYEYYISDDKRYLIRREYGRTPNGNLMNGRWVMRDQQNMDWDLGNMIDFDKYRNDLFERNDIIIYKRN